MTGWKPIAASLALAWLIAAGPVAAGERRDGGKLLLTDGITSVEGAAGGGIATWALIAGQETDAGIGATAHATLVELPDYRLHTLGGAIGLWDRVELSVARQRFDTRAVGAALGLGRGFTLGQDVFGAKLRVVGDAVWDQDRILPQIAIGIQHKRATKGAVLRAVGARATQGTDLYVAATKVVLSRGLVLDVTARATRANQLGLLGFGGDRRAGRQIEVEASAGKLVTPRLLVGAEFRSRPNNLRFAEEDDGFDLFAAWAPLRHVKFTAAYADLGDVATARNQRGLFLSAQAGF